MQAPAARTKNMPTPRIRPMNQYGSRGWQAKGVACVSQNCMALQSSSVLQRPTREETLHSPSDSFTCSVLTTMRNALGDKTPKGEDSNIDKVAPVDCGVHGLSVTHNHKHSKAQTGQV